ncbi:MAG: S1C family serine protease, partial [Phormidesmis sp.]
PEGIELPTATLGDSQSLALGQLVSTVGQSALNSTLNSNRGGDRGRGRRSSVNQGVDQADLVEQAAAPSDENTQQPTTTFASVGIVSQISGPWRSQSGGQLDQRIAVSLNLRRGSAGCPLINASGQVVGFNTFGPRRSVLTIPATTVNRVVDQLQQRGKISRGYLGLGMQMVALPENVQQQHELTQPAGIMVISVESDSAANQAGMVLGDMMIAIDDMPLESLRQMQALLNPQSVGQTMSVRLLRGGQMQTVAVTVGER